MMLIVVYALSGAAVFCAFTLAVLSFIEKFLDQ